MTVQVIYTQAGESTLQTPCRRKLDQVKAHVVVRRVFCVCFLNVVLLVAESVAETTTAQPHVANNPWLVTWAIIGGLLSLGLIGFAILGRHRKGHPSLIHSVMSSNQNGLMRLICQELAPHGYLLLGEQEQVLGVSPEFCQFVNLPAPRFYTGKNPFSFLDGRTVERVYQFLEQQRFGEDGTHAHLPIILSDEEGGKKLLNIVRAHHNGSTHTLVYLSPVVKEGRALSSSVITRKEHSSLVASVAHNLNNTLTAVMGAISLLECSKLLQDAEREKKLVRNLRESATVASHVVKDVMQFELARAGQSLRRPTEVLRIVESVLEAMHNFEGAENWKFHLDHSGALLALADDHGLHHVLTNLIANALDAMPNGGNITVRTKHWCVGGEDTVRIEVEDDGSGIPLEAQPRLFEPFYTTKKSKRGKNCRGGTGLGLYSSKCLVEAWGGRITFRSETGKGTVFLIELASVGEASEGLEAP